MLLHGDLHHENVLSAGADWRAIDAKGVVGDPGYETGLLFYNPMPRLFQVPNLRELLARRVDQLAEELEMERARIRGWDWLSACSRRGGTLRTVIRRCREMCWPARKLWQVWPELLAYVSRTYYNRAHGSE